MLPFVSIILPVRNEEKFIIPCLQSIVAQDYPQDRMELLIVDGMSNDSTVVKVNEFKVQSSKFKDIQVLKNPKQVVSSARNIAIKKSSGEIIVCMDAHAMYSPDYISSCVKVMEETGAANVGGPALALPGGDGPMARAITLAHYSPFGLGGAQFRDPQAEGFVETVWPGCFKREVFDKVGYIEERRTRTEDIEFNSRLRAAGYKIYLSPLIKAYYYCRTTLRETWCQRWADGYEITHFLPYNPKAPRLRHFIPLIFVSSILLLSILAIITSPQGSIGLTGLNGLKLLSPFNPHVWNLKLLAFRLLFLELGAYFSAMLIAVIQAGWARLCNGQADADKSPNNDDTMGMPSNVNSITTVSKSYRNRGVKSIGSLALLPVVFLTLHFSYGLGSLWGLVTLPFWLGANRTRISADQR